MRLEILNLDDDSPEKGDFRILAEILKHPDVLELDSAYPSNVRRELEEGQGFLLGAYSENQLVGFVAASYARRFPMQVSEKMGTINDLYVLPPYRRRGIGRKLVNECLEKMKSGDVDSVRINLVSGNDSALSLYQKLGFVIYRHSVKKPINE